MGGSAESVPRVYPGTLFWPMWGKRKLCGGGLGVAGAGGKSRYSIGVIFVPLWLNCKLNFLTIKGFLTFSRFLTHFCWVQFLTKCFYFFSKKTNLWGYPETCFRPTRILLHWGSTGGKIWSDEGVLWWQYGPQNPRHL